MVETVFHINVEGKMTERFIQNFLSQNSLNIKKNLNPTKLYRKENPR